MTTLDKVAARIAAKTWGGRWTVETSPETSSPAVLAGETGELKNDADESYPFDHAT